MSDPVTPNIGLSEAVVNADADTWGGTINGNWVLIDALFSVGGSPVAFSKVGVGKTASYDLDVNGRGGFNATLYLAPTNNSFPDALNIARKTGAFSTVYTNTANFNTSDGTPYQWNIGGTQALTIGGGNATALVSGNQVSASGVTINDTGSNNGGRFASFIIGGVTEIGSIRNSTNTGVQYVTTSDARLKTNIADATDAGAVIDALRVRQWDWKSTGSHEAYGFVAQEEAAVYAPAVAIGDDDPETIEKQWGRDDSKLVPLLVKEVQALRIRIGALETALKV